ncbi:hypothetical protein PoB_002547900 [Plakobranchus ocellatus]|uniref:Uncharacterized protein n=1 Tax=Plakobranchus ocellatus TaxID=259542 RepID=A0AAV3ZX28_9GAST|nr:hypothetical protein PoB_002547900 [Plakobranchus ocellatus]
MRKRNMASDTERERSKIVTLCLTPSFRNTKILVMLASRPNKMMRGQLGDKTQQLHIKVGPTFSISIGELRKHKQKQEEEREEGEEEEVEMVEEEEKEEEEEEEEEEKEEEAEEEEEEENDEGEKEEEKEKEK